MPSEYKTVLTALGKSGDFKEGVLKVNIPRNDLRVTINKRPAPTPFGFGGWIALTKGSDGADVLMGDHDRPTRHGVSDLKQLVAASEAQVWTPVDTARPILRLLPALRVMCFDADTEFTGTQIALVERPGRILPGRTA